MRIFYELVVVQFAMPYSVCMKEDFKSKQWCVEYLCGILPLRFYSQLHLVGLVGFLLIWSKELQFIEASFV